jgi:hypothetical protein
VAVAVTVPVAVAVPPPAPAPVVAPAGVTGAADPARTVALEGGRPVPPAAAPAAPPAAPRRASVRDIFDFADDPERPPPRRRRRAPRLAGALLGSRVRFLLAAALLAGSLWWMHVRGLLPSAAAVDEAATWSKLWGKAAEAPPLEVPGVPPGVTGVFCSVNAAVAGLALLVSVRWRSWKMGVCLLPAAALMSAGPVFWTDPVGPLSAPLACLAGGGALAVLGFLFGRDT